MTDRIKESLSSLFDGESDELEVRRVLNQIDKDPELLAQWQHMQMMRDVMRDQATGNVNLLDGIHRELDGTPEVAEFNDSVSVERPAGASWLRWVSGGAVAASVTLAVLLGVKGLEPSSPTEIGVSAVAAPSAIQSSGNLPSTQIAKQSVPAAPAGESASDVNEQDLGEAQLKLQEYVLRQMETPTLPQSTDNDPFARTVDFDQQKPTQER